MKEPRSARARRAAALLAASMAVVSLATVVTHEAGHWLLDRAWGADVRVVAPLFGAPRIEAVRPIAVDLMGWPDAAGPLANVLIGVALFSALWRRRRPLLLPLLLWAPVALLQESVNALVQLGTQAAGTDLVRLVASGVPAPVLTALAVVGIGLGLLALLALLPVAGVPATSPWWGRFAVLAVGLGAYPLLGLALTPWLTDPSVQRNATLLTFGVLIAALLSAARGPACALWPWLRRQRPAQVSAAAAWTAFAAAIAVHVAVWPLA